MGSIGKIIGITIKKIGEQVVYVGNWMVNFGNAIIKSSGGYVEEENLEPEVVVEEPLLEEPLLEKGNIDNLRQHRFAGVEFVK